MAILFPPLKTRTLTASTESPSIGSKHKHIMQEKIIEFSEEIMKRKCQLDDERVSLFNNTNCTVQSGINTQSGSDDNASSFEDKIWRHQQSELDMLHALYQERLDQLYAKFQREWERDPREKTASFPKPTSGSETAYLGEILGDALGCALAELCEKRPSDPIEYLSSWLRKYAENLKLDQEAAILSLKVKLQQEEEILVKDKMAIMIRERQQIKQEEQRRRKLFLENSSQIKSNSRPQSCASDDALGPTEDDTTSATKRTSTADQDTPNPSLYTIEEREGEGLSEEKDE